MKPVTKTLRFEFKQVKITKDAAGECLIEGYANTSTKDRVGDVVLPSAFEKCLPTYLKNPVLLMNHNWEDVAGVVTHAEITDKGLFVRGRISDTREDVKTLIREGCLRTFSIGYNELDADMDEGSKTKIVKELELLEISVVSIPANTEAMFTAVTAKDETPTGEKETTEGKKAKTTGELKTYIAMVKSVCSGDLGEDGVMAVIDYFNMNGEHMNEKELIEKLRGKTKSATEAKPADQAKQDDAAKPGAEAAPAAGDADVLKEILAKINAMGEAMAQMFEKINAMGQEEASEEKPKEEDKPADEEKPADEGKGDDKPADEEKPMKDEEEDKDEDKDDEEKDLPTSLIDQEIAKLDEQIRALDDASNV